VKKRESIPLRSSKSNVEAVVEHHKSIRRMARQNVPMKDVAACDKLRGGGKQPLIRRCPNGETPCGECRMTLYSIHRCKEGTWGSETSQYPEEKKKYFSLYVFIRQARRMRTKSESIPLVAASERGTVQTSLMKLRQA
jgi:hypothetical protein